MTRLGLFIASLGFLAAADSAAKPPVPSSPSSTPAAAVSPADASPARAGAAAGPGAPEGPKKPAAWLGIAIADVLPNEIPAAYAPTTPEGAVKVLQVFRGTKAEQAGLKEGDILLSINGADLHGRKTLLDTIHSKGVSEMVELRIGRDGKAFKQKMGLSAKPEDVRSITQMLVGGPAPVLDGKYYSGDAGSLAQNKGKVVLVDFWATWCGPCRMSLPTLDALYKKYHAKGVEIIGVSSESLPDLKAFQATAKLSYPLFNDIGHITTNQYQALAFPTLAVIDRQGVIQRMEVGVHDPREIEKWIKEYL